MGKDPRCLVVDEHLVGQRLDKLLVEKNIISSRSLAAKYIQKKLILINDQPTKPSYSVKLQDKIKMFSAESEPSELIPYDFPLEILFEDSDLIVLVKPSGLVVHPSPGHHEKTLVNALLYHSDHLSMGVNEQRPGIVHRLDRETSGIMVVAKTNEAHAHLAQQFKDKTTHRIYHAIVYGPAYKINPQITVENYLARHPKDRKKFASLKSVNVTPSKGKWASTTFTLLEHFSCGLSLVQCQLKTGRTHQIRIHLSEMGYAIVGDNTYGNFSRSKNLKSVKLRTQIKNLNRIALHAAELGFTHPTSKERLLF
ncbi:MAG: RluA family pseudouridine synthase, partial [Bdellovibrionales bacterium]|nr:RluA family pseudouridine synthase [Bdellovibrionales bacterium]